MISEKGFTLIEVIVYIALLVIVLGGILVVTYQLVEGTNKTLAKVIVQEEANFVLRKIDWGLSNIDDINSPTADSSGASLSIDKLGGSTVVFDLSDGAMRIDKGSGPAVLTTSNITVTNLNFTRATVGDLEKVTVSFEINGLPYSMTRSLRYE